jgi:hypothetical protein
VFWDLNKALVSHGWFQKGKGRISSQHIRDTSARVDSHYIDTQREEGQPKKTLTNHNRKERGSLLARHQGGRRQPRTIITISTACAFPVCPRGEKQTSQLR